MSGLQLQHQRRRRLAANSRPTRRSERSGPNTSCETPLNPSGTCRPQLDPRLHCCSFTPWGESRAEAHTRRH
jgi:hypothetical protein